MSVYKIVKSVGGTRGVWFLALLALAAGSIRCGAPPSPTPSSPTPSTVIEEDVCLKAIADLTTPKIGKVGGIPAANAKDKTNPPAFKYAVIELEILDYDKNAPPIIKVFDEQTNQPLDTVEFRPLRFPCEAPIPKLIVPIFLAYDSDPWKNTDKEPAERITRIELHMPVLNHVETAYAKLNKGIFVVPVFWHNVAESSRNGEVYVDNQDVVDLFWKQPKEYDSAIPAPDVNSIWGQAGVQFRLLNTSVPFHLASIPTQVVESPDKSSASDCLVGWTKNLSDKEGVDIYAVYKLTSGGADVHGIGNCFAQGHILLKAGNPNFSNPGSPTDPTTVAHEFGHYLGGLCHVDQAYCQQQHNADPGNNLMTLFLSGWKLEPSQIAQVRQQIKYKGYNEKK
jgi:hypothetical protein